MRQTTGTTFIFKLVIIFTFLFACFLALTINYNRAFKIKNEALTIIEKYEGINKNSLTIINNYLSSSGYTTKGKCNLNGTYYGVRNLDSTEYELVDTSTDYYYCFSEKIVRGRNNLKNYEVVIFYNFNLPVVGDLMKFKITGETNTINTNVRLGG